jgi:acetyl/propionyl-CoA carboxylase alpha subunit
MRERDGRRRRGSGARRGLSSVPGTVEFIVDAEGRHHFLEMNTRLQVEHPVTECVTGLDLVEWQLRVAAGEPLPLADARAAMHGHAIEARLYAEDPSQAGVPQTGRVLHWRPQAALNGRRPGAATTGGVRIDAGIAEGSEIGPHYDAMVAKLIAHGRDRDDAIRRLRAALADAPLVGVGCNTAFLRALLDHARFRTASLHTGLIDEWAAAGEPPLQRREPQPTLWALAAAMITLRHGHGMRPASVADGVIVLQMAGHDRALSVRTEGSRARVRAAGGEDATHEVRLIAHDDHLVRYEIDGVRRQRVALWQSPPGAHGSEVERLHLVDDDGHAWACAERSPYPALLRADDPRRACAAVAGTVVAVSVQIGQSVSAGQPLVCVEAMKMEMWQHAGADARVIAVHVQPRQAVDAGALLVELEIGQA